MRKIVKRYRLLGTDGKWHAGTGFPVGVQHTGGRSPYYVMQQSDGCTYGKRYDSLEDAETALARISA